jgi:leucine dehydrogenase
MNAPARALEVERLNLFSLSGEPAHEKLLFVSDTSTGLRAIIAVHDTSRGSAFGGCRYWQYPSDQDALVDAMRLSKGMSLKNAMADLPFGGGKSVILKGVGQEDRAAMFRAFGHAIASLSGQYIAGEDVGTTTEDLLQIGSVTSYAAGIPRVGVFGGNPSPKTALGVFAAIERGAHILLGGATLQGLTVCIQGLGAVGWALAQRLHAADCRLVVADIDDARADAACKEFGARKVSTAAVFRQEADVFAPCALGAALNAETVASLRVKIIAGAANNQLATEADGDALHVRGIHYLPDYLVNAGGIVSCVREYEGGSGDVLVDLEVMRIADRVEELIQRASCDRESLARAADKWAKSKLRRPALP